MQKASHIRCSCKPAHQSASHRLPRDYRPVAVVRPRRWGRSRLRGQSHPTLKGLSHLVQSCLVYQSCMSKDSARSTGHVRHFFPKKILRSCEKSTFKDLINLGFVTSFEDSHYILLFRYIYGVQHIQWFCYSKHLHVNSRSYQWSKWSIAKS